MSSPGEYALDKLEAENQQLGLQVAFVLAFRDVQKDAFAINQKHGFNDANDLLVEFEKYMRTQVSEKDYERFKSVFEQAEQGRVGLRLMLMVSELSELLEGVRKNVGPDSHIPEFTNEEAELADTVIRAMNYATERKLRLAEAIIAKQNYNRTRPFRHGGKAF